VDHATIRQRLLEERAAVLGMGQDLAVTFEDMVAAAKDSNLDDEHDPEGATIAAERQLVAALEATAAQRLAAIDQALARLDAGGYGRCVECGGDIGAGRLDARPAAAHCIECASRKGRR
jgi:RNA polymerase-binding protein DksA